MTEAAASGTGPATAGSNVPSTAPVCPFTAGKITVVSLGLLVDSPGFYRDPSKGLGADIVVFPVGYQITRPGPAKDPAVGDVPYHGEIRANEDGTAPVFVVTPSDAPEECVSAATCRTPWQSLHEARRPGVRASINGLQHFGLTNPVIAAQLRRLSGGEALFGRLDAQLVARPERPQRTVVPPRAPGEDQARPAASSAASRKASGGPLSVPASQGDTGSDVCVVPHDVDTGLPAKRARKPPRATPQAGGAAEAARAPRRLVQRSLSELLGGSATAASATGTAAPSGDNGGGAALQRAFAAVAASGPGLRPLLDKSDAAKAKTVFFADFESSSEAASWLKQTSTKQQRKALAQFMWQYTSERAKMEMLKRHGKVCERLAREAAKPAAATPAGEGDLLGDERSMDLLREEGGVTPGRRAQKRGRSSQQVVSRTASKAGCSTTRSSAAPAAASAADVNAT